MGVEAKTKDGIFIGVCERCGRGMTEFEQSDPVQYPWICEDCLAGMREMEEDEFLL